MSKYESFEHFARDLFLHRTNAEVHISKLSLKGIPLLGHASTALDLFTDGHNLYYSFTDYSFLELKSEEQFFKFLIPRCLKLIDNERYFYSLMMVGSLVQDYLRFLKSSRYCYRFHFTAYKCFLAVFNRAFADKFETNGGLEALGKFCEAVVKSVDTIEKYQLLPITLNNENPELVERVIELAQNCCDIPAESFQLNDYEQSLLKDGAVEEVLRSLGDGTGPPEDPLDLNWPPAPEEIKTRMKAAIEDCAKELREMKSEDMQIEFPEMLKPYAEDFRKVVKTVFEKGIPDQPLGTHTEEEEKNIFCLQNYILTLENLAVERLGFEGLREKMELRRCPCCGIRCFQFARKLYLKQLDSGLTDRSN